MPILDRPWILASAVLYLAAIGGIGAWSARHTRSSRDFFIAGQRLGLWVTALATMSAAFSGFVFLGGPGLTYRIGLSSLFINASIGFTAALLCWVVGRRLRALAGVREVFTVADAVACRYDSRAAAGLAAIAVAVGSVGYLAAQLLALTVVLEAVFGLGPRLGAWGPAAAMAIGLGIIVAYAAAGGMVAGAYTDLLQGALMLAGAVTVFAWALAAPGGWHALTGSIARSPRFGTSFLAPLGRTPAAAAFGLYFVFGVGVLGQPHMLHKFYMLRDERKLRYLPAILGGSQIVCLLIWFGVGLAVPALVAQGRLAALARPDDAAPLFLLGFTPAPVAGLAFAAVLAAIMSTADSFLNIGAAALVRDLPRALGRPLADELASGRRATVVIAVLAAGLALGYGDLVALLGTFAFGTFAAALTPALAVGLNWRGASARAASASIATGLVLNLGLEALARQTLWPALRLPARVLPSAIALAASFAVFVLVSLWRRDATARLEPEVASALDLAEPEG